MFFKMQGKALHHPLIKKKILVWLISKKRSKTDTKGGQATQ
jgi:hypothetical protein